MQLNRSGYVKRRHISYRRRFIVADFLSEKEKMYIKHEKGEPSGADERTCYGLALFFIVEDLYDRGCDKEEQRGSGSH